MATLKQRLLKKNSSGAYDTIHLETSATNVLMSNGTTVEAAVNGKAASNHTHTAAQVGALATNGTAAAATKLATARNVQVNLASTAAASFNGTANITPGVTGVLPIARGGTGVNDFKTLCANIADASIGNTHDTSITLLEKTTETPVTIDVAAWLAQHPDRPWFYITGTQLQLRPASESFLTFLPAPKCSANSNINVRTGGNGQYILPLIDITISDSTLYLCRIVLYLDLDRGETLKISTTANQCFGMNLTTLKTFKYTGGQYEFFALDYTFRMHGI